MSDTDNQDTPVAWVISHPNYGKDLSFPEMDEYRRRNGWLQTPLYSSDHLDRMRERAERAEAKAARLRNKVSARRLSDADLIDEDFAVDAVIDAGFGEGGGCPGEWWYERAGEIAHEIKRRQLERQLAQHNSKPALTKLQDTSHE